jgi:hypothetical protein
MESLARFCDPSFLIEYDGYSRLVGREALPALTWLGAGGDGIAEIPFQLRPT